MPIASPPEYDSHLLKSHMHPTQYVDGVRTSMQYLQPYLV